MASMGSRLAALRAGKKPKTMPMKVQTSADTTIDHSGMEAGKPITPHNSVPPHPTRIPKTPPDRLMMTLSIKN